ncbi:MAG: hypothetical protein IKK45_08150 [Akkermansia sp.]|nr:hypothetical protein [Akkermansia sp.]
MSFLHTLRFLLLAAVLASVVGGVCAWVYINDMVQPVLEPLNQAYTGYSNVPRRAPGLKLEVFEFTGWDGLPVQAVLATKDGEESSRQLSVIGSLAAQPATRLGQIDYVLVSVDWDHGIRSALPLAESLTAAGIACVLWDSRGKDNCRTYCTHGLQESRDVPALLDAVTKRSGMAHPVFAAVGQGYGASLLLQAAAMEPRIRGLVAIDAYASLRQSVVRTIPETMWRPIVMGLMDMRIRSIAGMESFEVAPGDRASDIKRDVPVLIVNLLQDNPVSTLEDALMIYRRLRSERREVWTLRSAEDSPESTSRDIFYGNGRRKQTPLSVRLVQDADSALPSIIHWMNEHVVDAVEAPRVVAPSRPVPTSESHL